MCGIAGLINLDGTPVSPVLLKKMTDEIAHRGPDDEGQWIDKNVGIGHRRLAILDLSSAGHQPMITADQRFVLSYNGEIYNFKELRAELESGGVCFLSQTDSEVVLQALVKWGVDAITRFNGMFALALWDREERQLLLARDRYGIKPLYYALKNRVFSFASEQKAILADCRFQRNLDKQALLEYFTFQNIFTDRTLLQDMKLLPAGCFLVFNLAKKQIKPLIRQYWDFDFREPSEKADKKEYAQELRRLFTQAVNRQLVTDVEIGSYLSGGMDSGSITAVAAASCPYIKTFTCGFDLHSASGLELGFDERAKSELMSYKFKTEHYEMVLKAGDMERSLPNLVWHIEEPRVGQSYPNYYAAKLASKFVKVVLSGAGGDELFGGYPWRYYRAVNNSNFDAYVKKYYKFWQRLLPNEKIKSLFGPVWSEIKGISTQDVFRNVFKHHSEKLCTPEDYINHSLYFEAKTFLNGLLVVEDKLSMAHGLETRLPFLDNDLVEFAMKCPVSLKLNNLSNVMRLNENDPGALGTRYFQKTKDGKQLLREAMKKTLPLNIINAPKQGFSSPDASWFKGDSIDFVKKTLMTKGNRYQKFLDIRVAQDLVNSHISGDENRRLFIWSLLSFEEWLEQNIASDHESKFEKQAGMDE